MESTSSSDIRQFLHACERGDKSWVENALSSGLVQVDDCDDQGLTGLQAVAANGYEELARLLIMKGAALEKSNIFDWTPLLHAARHGHTGVVALLIQNNAEINKVSSMGANALTCAVRGGHVKTAQYLLDRGIEFDTVASPCELSAMFVACLLGHDSLLRLLTDRGWDINQRMQSTFMTPLMCTAINGHMTTSQIMMERGCDPNLTDVNDKTALQLASECGKREVSGYLDRKTSNKSSTVEQDEKQTDILEATKSGDIERVQEILQSDPSQKDYAVPQEGATPLMYASMSGRYDIASLLIDSGCDIDRQDKVSGWTALMQAVFHGKKQLAKYLISCGADVSISAKNGITAFDMASFIDDVDTDLLRLLASKAMNPKSDDNQDSLKKRDKKRGSLTPSEAGFEGGSKKWWSKFTSQFRNLTRTVYKRNNSKLRTEKVRSSFSRAGSSSTMDLSGTSATNVTHGTSLSLLDKKKSASLYHLNSMTPYSTATMPLGLGGGGAVSGETLKPVIPPFLPQPSFDLAAETWAIPTNQKSQSTLDLTVNRKHPMIRPTSVRARDGLFTSQYDSRATYGSPSPSSSGGASSISAVFSAPTSGSSATSSTLTPGNVDRFHRRAVDLDIPSIKPPSFLLNPTSRHSSLPRLHSPFSFSPNSSSNSSAKRNQRQTGKQKLTSNASSSLTTSLSHVGNRSKSLSDSGTSSGNAEFLSLSSSSQGVIHELEAEYEADNNDIGTILKDLSLEKYQPIFEKEEIDMEAFLMLDETDLCELGIAQEESRRQILTAITDLGSAKHVRRQDGVTADEIGTSIRVRDSVHSDSTDLDDWYLDEQPKSNGMPSSCA